MRREVGLLVAKQEEADEVLTDFPVMISDTVYHCIADSPGDIRASK